MTCRFFAASHILFRIMGNDVSFILQLIWGDAIFVKVVAVSFSLSFVARIELTKLKTTA